MTPGTRIVILGVLAILRMPTGIFPEIDIPVVSVIWSYSGIYSRGNGEAITMRSERGFTGSVNDIEHLESQSLAGLGVIKVFFHPRSKIEAAVAQLNAASNSSLHNLPVGTTPRGIWNEGGSSASL